MKLEQGLRYHIRQVDGKDVYVGKLPQAKKWALYVQNGAGYTPLAWFVSDEVAAQYVQLMHKADRAA